MDEREITTSVDMKSIKSLCEEYKKYNYIPPELYERFDIKRGLRNQDGTGVIAGLTHIRKKDGDFLFSSRRLYRLGCGLALRLTRDQICVNSFLTACPE